MGLVLALPSWYTLERSCPFTGDISINEGVRLDNMKPLFTFYILGFQSVSGKHILHSLVCNGELTAVIFRVVSVVDAV